MDFSEAEKKRTYQLNSLIGFIGGFFLLAFGINALINGRLILAVNLILAAAVGLVSLLLMRWTDKVHFGTYGVTLAASYMFLYLIISGGIDGTGPLWCYSLIALITFLQGLRRGLCVVVGLTVLTLMLMFIPDLPFTVAEYSTPFKIRFIASFLALAAMALIYEYMRSESQSRYRAISSRLDKVSRTDELTGVANRRQIQYLLEMELARFIRYGQPFSVIMLDLDRFKQLNDSFGHAFGDRILKEVASQLSANIRATDHVARWGGEEFLILLPQTNLAQAAAAAEKLRLAVAEIDPADVPLREAITASLGVQSIEYAESIETLIIQADDRLYQAKNGGRNLVVAEDAEGPETDTG